MGMAGGPVRLPLDELDEKKTEQLKKVLSTIPEINWSYGKIHKNKIKKIAEKKVSPKNGRR